MSAISAVRNISDTARWVAYFRALETRRPDALFRDPYAERLAGERGVEIAKTLADGDKHEWAWAARTYLFDTFLAREVAQGADLVLNLAAGLDTRPYRMDISSQLRWVEIDLPEIVAYKEEVLANDRPKCSLQRISLDLSNRELRRRLFAEIGKRSTKVVVMSEGLLIYLSAEEVGALANDLGSCLSCQTWLVDLVSPGQLRLMQRTTGVELSEAGAAFKFGPLEGPNFFVPYGWNPIEIQGLLKTAAQFNRSPRGLLPLGEGSKGVFGNFPWTGVCLLRNEKAGETGDQCGSGRRRS